MYNIYAFEKKINQKELMNIRNDSVIRNKTRDMLSTRYRHRINDSLLMLSDENSQMSCIVKELEYPSLYSSKASKKVPQRSLNSTDHKLANLTPSPQRAFNLRPRNKIKEIQPNLIFKFFGSKRLEENLDKQRKLLDTSLGPNLINPSKIKEPPKLKNATINGGKTVYGYYHFKTHFKTIESLALDLHSSIRNCSKSEIKKHNYNQNLGFREESGSFNTDKISKEEIMPMCSEILEKYGLWKERPRSKSPYFQR